jgi:putative DNA primase/helicase
VGAAADLAQALGGARPNGKGGYLAYCPNHEADGGKHHASLNIDEGENGRPVVYCLAHGKDGCSQAVVIARLKARGLWIDRPEHRREQRATLKSVSTIWTPIAPTADTPAHPLAHPKRGRPNGLWGYKDAESRTFACDFRFDKPNGGKDVLPCTWCQNDSGARAWRWMSTKPRPIYGLDRLAARPEAPVLLVSGCKCTDAGERLVPTHASVTWQGGDDSVELVDWKALAGRTVVVWADNDPSGIKAMRNAAARLKLLGCSVRFVQIPAGAPVSWDIADAEAEGMSSAGVMALLEGATDKEPELIKPEGAPSGSPGKPGDVPEYSESALVDEFERFCGANLNHCRDHWKSWTGKQWRLADKLVLDFAETVGRAAAGRAMYTMRNGERVANRVASAHTFRAIESTARNRSSLSSEPKDWDADPFLLGTPNGVVDLRTGKLLEPKREYRITKSTAVTPADTSAGAVRWLKALHLIYQDDEEQIEHVQKLLGYCCTGDVREDLIAVAIGKGGNGKTVVWATAARILGTYAHVMAAEALMETYAPRHPEELARLQGVRLAIASEIFEGKMWNVQRLQMLSGREDIPCRDMYGKSFFFPMTGKLIIYGNQLPGLRTVDVAITGRMRIIMHPVLIRGTQLDIKGLDHILVAEWPYILRWMIEGTQKWLRDGLKPPAAVVNATRDYFHAEDEFGGWLSTCCRTWPTPAWTDDRGVEHPKEEMPTDGKGEPANYTSLAALKLCFDKWLNPYDDKIRGIDPTTLGRKLRKKGYRTQHLRIGTVVWGLKVLEAPIKKKEDGG